MIYSLGETEDSISDIKQFLEAALSNNYLLLYLSISLNLQTFRGKMDIKIYMHSFPDRMKLEEKIEN